LRRHIALISPPAAIEQRKPLLQRHRASPPEPMEAISPSPPFPSPRRFWPPSAWLASCSGPRGGVLPVRSKACATANNLSQRFWGVSLPSEPGRSLEATASERASKPAKPTRSNVSPTSVTAGAKRLTKLPARWCTTRALSLQKTMATAREPDSASNRKTSPTLRTIRVFPRAASHPENSTPTASSTSLRQAEKIMNCSLRAALRVFSM
jgi:hypothetical protein